MATTAYSKKLDNYFDKSKIDFIIIEIMQMEKPITIGYIPQSFNPCKTISMVF